MAEKTASELPIDKSHIIRFEQPSTSKRLAQFPWWLIGIAAVILWVAITIVVNENYNDVFNFIKAGLGLTAFTSIVSFFIAALLGLITGIGRVSRNVVVSNIATFYVEFIRGIPMLVLIFFLALVGVPAAVDGFNLIFSGLGNLLGSIGLDSIGQFIASSPD